MGDAAPGDIPLVDAVPVVAAIPVVAPGAGVVGPGGGGPAAGGGGPAALPRVAMFAAAAVAAPVLNPLIAPLAAAPIPGFEAREADLQLSAAEQAEATLHPNGVIPPGHYFTDDHNPYQANGVSYLQSFENILPFLEHVTTMAIRPTIHRNTVIRANLRGYELSVVHGCIMEVWYGCAFGFNQICNATNTSVSAITATLSQANSPDELNHMNNFGFQVLRYILNFIVPIGNVQQITLTSLTGVRRCSFRSSMRGSKCNFVPWSQIYVTGIVVQQNQAAICDGHMIEFLVFLLRVVPKLFRKLQRHRAAIHVAPGHAGATWQRLVDANNNRFFV